MIGVTETDDGTKAMVRKKLSKFQDELPDKVRARLEEVWDKIWSDAIMLCPIDTGALAASIKVIEGSLGALLGGIKGVTIFDRTITAGDIMVVNPRSNMPTSDYALMVHDGHATKGGGSVPAQPFLTDAIAMNEAEIDAAVTDAMKELGEDYSG